MAIESAEFLTVEILAGSDTGSSNVAGSQDVSQSAIFSTYLFRDTPGRADSRDGMVERAASPDRVIATRGEYAELQHSFGVSIPEFSAGVTIQRGQFTLGYNIAEATQAITAVASLSQAFLVMTVVGSDWQFPTSAAYGYFSADDEITFTRAQGGNALTIEWYVIEDDGAGSIFSVTPFTIDMANLTTGTAAISSVDMGKAFVVAGATFTSGSRAQYNTNVYLSSATEVTANCGQSSAVIMISGFVIEMGEATASVQRGSHTFSDGGVQTESVAVTEVDDGVPWHPQQGNSRAGGKVLLTQPTATTIEATCCSKGVEGESAFWELIEFGSGGAGPSPTDESLPVAMMGVPF